ncbi:MAG: MFS transporter [Alphaproteobacteria bacterium]|nr:MAG: MFS transporter [Alphaproteobacteria bacterium]
MPGIVALCVAYVLSQFYRSFLAVLVPYLSTELGMSAAELAYASGTWFAAFALAQFPIGAWLDRYGPRRTAAWLHAAAGGGGAALFALAQSPLHVIVAMGLIGIGCAPVLMATFYVFARNYSAAGFATLASTFIAAGSLGNIAGSAPMALAVEQFGWRPSLWFLCAVTLATALAVLVLVRDPRRAAAHAAARGGYLDLIRIRQLWPIFPMIFLGYAVAGGIRGLWVGPYLQDVHQLGTVAIGQVTLAMAIALSLGSLLYGPLDRLFDSRKWVVFFGNLMVLAAVAWLAVAPAMAVAQATVMFVVIGLLGASYAVQIAHGKAFVPEHLTGRGVTLMNFFSIGGVGAMQFVTGRTLSALGPTADPQWAYSVLFGLYAGALALVLVAYLASTDARPREAAVGPV